MDQAEALNAPPLEARELAGTFTGTRARDRVDARRRADEIGPLSGENGAPNSAPVGLTFSLREPIAGALSIGRPAC